MPAGRKWPPPDGYTGADGVDPSGADIAEWTAHKADGNVCLRLPETVVGIDVDAYGTKPGAAALTEAESRYGELPSTVMSTSRADGVSGVRLYRLPNGVTARRSIVSPGIEVVRRGHRYVVVPPSVHPDTSDVYRWLDSETGAEVAIPAPNELPVLPDAWARFLAEGASPAAKGDAASVQLTDGEPSAAVSAALDAAIKAIAAGASRHDAMLAHVLTLLRHAEAREDGTAAALGTLREVFVGAIGDRSSPAAARAEFDRIVEGGKAIIAGDPHIDVSEVDSFDGLPKAPTVADVETEFWESRAELTTIRQFALARLTPPWAVLGCVLTRVIAHVPPWVTLPPVIGSRASVNLFIVLSGATGGGKSTGSAVAAELYPGPPLALAEERPTTAVLGTGQGIPTRFVEWQGAGKKRTLVRTATSVMFVADEIDTLASLGAANQAHLLSALRRAGMGGDLGETYRAQDTRLPVEAHSYRMTLVIGGQPTRLGFLAYDEDGGTPQRFVWLPAYDAAITDDPPPEPMPISTPRIDWQEVRTQTGPQGHIGIPEPVVQELRRARVASARGVGGADSHLLLTQEKVAYGMAVLDGRGAAFTEEDWRLAGVVIDRSTATRAEVKQALGDEAAQRAAARGRSQGIADEAQQAYIDEATERTLAKVRKRVRELCAVSDHTERALSAALSGAAQRRVLAAAVRLELDEGTIVEREERNRKGSVVYGAGETGSA